MKKELNVYESSPEYYDAMMSTALEMQIFNIVADEIKNNLKTDKNRILDLCCGTGILAQMLLDTQNIEFVGIDINKHFLESAKKKTQMRNEFKYILNDVLKYETNIKFDIIILTSAYHHIMNEFKTVLLRKILNWLKKDGTAIMYEKCIAPYNNQEDFKKSNQDFYKKRIEFLKKIDRVNLGKKQVDAIMNICNLSSTGKEEYKVSYDYIIQDLKSAGFGVLKEIKVWPNDETFDNKKIGDFVFVIKKVTFK